VYLLDNLICCSMYIHISMCNSTIPESGGRKLEFWAYNIPSHIQIFLLIHYLISRGDLFKIRNIILYHLLI